MSEQEQDKINTAFTDAYHFDNGISIFDVEELRNFRVSARYGSGETNRKKFCAELTPSFAESWKEFVTVFSGIDVKHGRGSVSSPLVQFSLQLFMAIVADLDTDEVVSQFVQIVENKAQMFDITERMKLMSEKLREELTNAIR